MSLIKEPGRYFGKYGEVVEMSGNKICVSLWSGRLIMQIVRARYMPTRVYDDMVEFDGIDAAKKPEMLKLVKVYSRLPASATVGRLLAKGLKAKMQELVLRGRWCRGVVSKAPVCKTHCNSVTCFR
jgi:hypothetical protein